MQHMVDLLGKTVSFIHTTKVEKRIFIHEAKGVVTNVLLGLDGKHEILLDDGEFYPVNDLMEFAIA